MKTHGIRLFSAIPHEDTGRGKEKAGRADSGVAVEGAPERGPREAGAVNPGRIGADAVEDTEVSPEGGEVAGAKAPLEGIG